MSNPTVLEPMPVFMPSTVANSAAALHRTVITHDYCIGCGVCTAPAGSPFSIELDERGFYRATWRDAAGPAAATGDTDYEALCPFGEHSADEDELAAALYPTASLHPRIGRHLACFAGWVEEGDYRAQGSSGGFAKWLLVELLERGEVDYVIQVFRLEVRAPGDVLYGFGISGRSEGVRRGSKSTYYPVEMSDVLRILRTTPARFAITGVPCFIKALRLLGRQEPLIAERVRFTVGVICGHLKSTQYAEMLGWQFGVPPEELASVDFRRKIPGARANEKGVEVRRRGDTESPPPRRVQELFGTDYGEGLFKYRACDYCDDVVAETADVAVGDAWLPQYMGAGTNVIVVRHPRIHMIVREACAAGRLHLEELPADEVERSQHAGLHHRREGLAYRLWLQQERGEWTPPKRVPADRRVLSAPSRRVQELRMRLSEASPAAFLAARQAGDFEVFRRRLEPLVRAHRTARARFMRKVLDRAWRWRTLCRARLGLLRRGGI